MTESIKYSIFNDRLWKGAAMGYWDKMLWEIFWSTPWGYHWLMDMSFWKQALGVGDEQEVWCVAVHGVSNNQTTEQLNWIELILYHLHHQGKPYLYYKSNEQYCIFNHDFKHFEGINKYKLWSITTDILILFNYLTQLCKR